MEEEGEVKDGAKRRSRREMKKTKPVQQTEEGSQDHILRESERCASRFVTGCVVMMVVRSQEGMTSMLKRPPAHSYIVSKK